MQTFNIKNHTFSKMNWIEFLSTGGGALILREAARLLNRMNAWKKKVPSRSIMKVTDLYETFKFVLDNTVACRFTIARVEDSGGPLIPGSDVYVSVTNEDYVKPQKPIADLFQRWKANKDYIEILRAVCENGSAKVDVSTLPKETTLRNVYDLSGIKHTEVYFIAQTKIKLFIATVSTDDPNGFVKAEDKVHIEIAINKLRNIFKEFYSN